MHIEAHIPVSVERQCEEDSSGAFYAELLRADARFAARYDPPRYARCDSYLLAAVAGRLMENVRR